MKTCTKCKAAKSLDNFSLDASKKDGRYSSCKSCYAAYYENNRKAKLEYKKVYRDLNKERIAAYRLKHYAENADHARATSIQWAKDNPVKRRVNQAKRRARKSVSGGRFSKGDVTSIFVSQKGKCVCCRMQVGDVYHIDHIMPLALGGSNNKTNIQILCPTCNQQKHAKHPIEFMQSKGYLL